MIYYLTLFKTPFLIQQCQVLWDGKHNISGNDYHNVWLIVFVN